MTYRQIGSIERCANPGCPEDFVLQSPNNLYCSDRCMIQAQRKRRRDRNKEKAIKTMLQQKDMTEQHAKEEQRWNKARADMAQEEMSSLLKDIFNYEGRAADVAVPDTGKDKDEQKQDSNKGLEDI